MKILFLTPQVPYQPDKGTTIRNLNLIKRVARQHEVDLLSFASSPGETLAAGDLLEYCGRVEVLPAPRRTRLSRAVTTLFSPWPDMALRLHAAAYAERLSSMLAAADYDFVQVEGIELMRYALGLRNLLGNPQPIARGLVPRSAGRGQAPALRRRTGSSPTGDRLPLVIFDDHNAEYVLQRRAFETDIRRPRKWFGAVYSMIQWQKLRGFERRVCRTAAAVLAVSEVDRQALHRLDPALEVLVVPNGIDSAFFAGHETTLRPEAMDREKQIIFVGTMDYRPNVDAMTWFCRQIFPLVHRAVPESRLQIIGRHPTGAIWRLASAGVTVRDDVADVRPELAKSAVYVVPMRIGGGVRFKLLEAMACRVPVVTTSMGADGIPAPPNQYFLVADEPAAFAHAVVELLRNPEKAAVMTEAAQRFVRERYEWEAIVPRLEELYERLRAGAVSHQPSAISHQ